MQTVVITGANRGIGLSLAKIYLERGDQVIAGCRSGAPELTAFGARVERLDVADDASVVAFGDRIREPVHLLICNAGLLKGDRLDALDLAAIRAQFEVNTLGPLKVVAALRERLAEGGKVGIVTSRMGSIADNSSGGMYGYRLSKAGVNMVGKSLSLDLKPRGVAVALLHPGWVRTEMTGGTGNQGPDEAAEGLVARLDALDLARSGSFWHADGTELPW